MRLKDFMYARLVIEAYKKKKVSNQLPLLLTQPTPANIRRACEHKYNSGEVEGRDRRTLEAYFGESEHGRKFSALISKFEADKFRPLDQFLKSGGERGINNLNLELLAWLIDFPHRPFNRDKEIILSEEEKAALENDIDLSHASANDMPAANENNGMGDEPGTKMIPELPYREPLTRFVRRALILVAIGLLGWTTYAAFAKKQRCMYWSGYQYVEVSCEERPDTLLLHYNEQKMQSTQRIKTPDTITERSIGKLYYFGNGPKKEYYTNAGKHPIYTTKDLRVLTKFIYDRYLGKKLDSVKSLALKKDSLIK